jgi:fructose-1,6-bisphosphatase II
MLIGGTPEGVIAACALRCMGGELQGRLWPKDEEERKAFIEFGFDPARVLKTEDLCKGEDVAFAATGVTDSWLLKGVEFVPGGATTSSIVMRLRSGTIREVKTHHKWNKDQQ